VRAFLWFGGACIALTLLRVAIQAGLVVLALGILVALIRAPGRTLTTLFGLLMLGAMASRPDLGLLFMTALLLASRAMPEG
jgi:hypothetical protein